MNSNRRQRPAFSLLEVMLVLVIIGLVMATVSLNWLPVLKRAQFSETVRKVQSIDQQARLTARTRGVPVRIIYGLEGNRIQFTRISNDGVETLQSFDLPEGHSIEQVLIRDDAVGESEYVSEINRFGISETLAVLVVDGSQEKWILFAGGTGQSQTFNDSSQIEFLNASDARQK
jgi:prepilin-type N-terminal cleavage/methylation domain-containing protein